MSRAPRREPGGWYWTDTENGHGSPSGDPTVETDADRHTVGTILGPTGKPLHTVRNPRAVDFGYRGQAT